MTVPPQTSAQIRREFLGWDRPALPEAARRIAKGYCQGETLDLRQVIVVVPGQRAGRRLKELLAFLAEDDNLRLTPPEVVTEGQLPEKLYTPKFPFANEIVQDLAWAQALRNLPARKLREVVPHPPAAADAFRWLELGKVLRGLHVELAADGLDFAAVRSKGPKLADFSEAQRWEVLTLVQRKYHDQLDAEKLWDKQTARLKAIELGEIKTEQDIILLGTVDLNDSLRQMLDQIAGRVTAFIIAPESLAERFDAHGCLVPAAWCETEIPLRDEQLRQVDDPVEQADAVTVWLGQLGGRFRKDEVAIGVPDESLVPQLQRQLEQCGVQGRWVEGVRLGETAPYRLLAAAVKFAGRRRYDELAALVRHPDCEGWLNATCTPSPPTPLPRDGGEGRDMRAFSLPAQLDSFYNAHLPSRVSAGQVPPNARDWPDLPKAIARIEEWLNHASASQPLRQWGPIFCKILGDVYGDRTVELDNPGEEVLHKTLQKTVEKCGQLGALPEALDTAPLPAADAFQVGLGPLAAQTLPPPADPEAVEILGWLELPLDDSRALVVTSFNERFVPQSTTADAFLPDRLRRELGLLHNERRYARDAYATCVLCHSRAELRVLLARRDVDDDPLKPSRLVFACPDDTMIGRARQFFAGRQATAAPRRLLLANGTAIVEQSLFAVPAPEKPTKMLERISVTRFKTYLACPYRYYLRHVRNLEAIDDTARELDGGAFGTLLHGALSALGRDPEAPRQSTREREVFEFLDDQLQKLAHKLFRASERRPAVRLQLEQARQRLQAFAREQVVLVQGGWRIVYAEDAEETRGDLSVPFVVDGIAITLVGRIDRIDFHEASRTTRILDYKTADVAQAPQKTHCKGEDWIDLQLPLYRHLLDATRLDVTGDCTVQLGYFNLPKMLDKTGVQLADWDSAALQAADEVARQVIRDLRDAKFGPPVYPAPDYSEDLAAICLDTVRSRPALVEDDQGGAA